MADSPSCKIPLIPTGVLDVVTAINASLNHVDGQIQAAVISVENDPPGSPTNGEQYLVGVGTGAWVGKDDYVARYTSEGAFWDFYAPGDEMRLVLSVDPFELLGWNGAAWAVVAGLSDAPVDGQEYVRKNGAWVVATGGGGGGSLPAPGYATYLAASLEPDAIEAVQKGEFSYAVGSSATKLLIASWATKLGSNGRMEVRNPQRYLPLRGVTLNGMNTASTAIIIDPTIPTYSDPWSTYYERLQAIHELEVKSVVFSSGTTGEQLPFLPGAYGAIITQYTCFDFTWLALRPLGGVSYGVNLWDEISDSAIQRVGDTLAMPIHKKCAGTIQAGPVGSSPLGTVCYVLLPSTWSKVADPISYTFRDDFMTASVNTGIWTRTQFTSGNVEIDTNYQWCKAYGSNSWGANGMYRTTGQSRSADDCMVIDVWAPLDAAASGALIVGWSDGLGQSYANFAHGLNFAAPGGTPALNVYENANARGTVGSGYTLGSIYRIRITLGASSATYEIQGGPEYPAIGGNSWTDITPGTSSSATATVHPAFSAFAGTAYVSDVRCYTVP